MFCFVVCMVVLESSDEKEMEEEEEMEDLVQESEENGVVGLDQLYELGKVVENVVVGILDVIIGIFGIVVSIFGSMNIVFSVVYQDMFGRLVLILDGICI